VLNSLSRVLARLLSRANVLDSSKVDMRSLGPVHVCFCGSRLFKVGCMFEDNDIAMWFVNGECAACGALVKVPTPADVK
jgi:hypothetical protein